MGMLTFSAGLSCLATGAGWPGGGGGGGGVVAGYTKRCLTAKSTFLNLPTWSVSCDELIRVETIGVSSLISVKKF